MIERDALNLRWHGRVPLDRVVLDAPVPDREVARALEQLTDVPGAPRLYYHNLDFPEFPCLTAIGYDQWLNRLAYQAGGGVGPNLMASLRSALSEYAQAERSIRVSQLTRNWQFGKAFEAMFGIREDATAAQFARYVQAIAYYGYPSHAAEARWCFEDGPELPLSEPLAREADLRALASRADVRGAGAALTRPDHVRLHPAGAAPHPADGRRLSPSCPNRTRRNAPALGHPRIVERARSSGVAGAASCFEELVTAPLPYP